MRLRILFICIMVSVSWGGCSTMVVSNFDDLSYFRKGMSMEEVDKFYDDDDLKKVHTFPIPNSAYVLKNTQVLVQFLQSTRNAPGTVGYANQQTTFQSRFNTFRLLFKNGKLLYWGFDYEFLSHSDPEIRQIGEMMRAFGIKEHPEDQR
ncbi:MAG: hypothetical protein ACKOAG_02645 [Candidatus Kapaibacterium sp.]